jgi:hypothetical protein
MEDVRGARGLRSAGQTGDPVYASNPAARIASSRSQ